MGVTSGPKIEDDGLIYCMDPANPRSFSGSGSVAEDIVKKIVGKSKRRASKHGNSAFTRSRGRGVFTMDGSDDYLSIPDSDELSGLSSFTICAWVKPTNNKNFWIISKGIGGSSGNREFALKLNHSGYPEAIIVDESADSTVNATSRRPINNNEWHYVVATWSGSHLKVYVNGGLSGPPTPTSLSIENLSSDIYIGRSFGSSTSDFANGYIGTIHIYNTTLSDESIKNNYVNGRARFPANTRGERPKPVSNADKLIFDCVTDSSDGSPKISLDLFSHLIQDQDVISDAIYAYDFTRKNTKTGGPHEFIIDWGDGTIERISKPSGDTYYLVATYSSVNTRYNTPERFITHEYSTSGIYTISIDGQIQDFKLGGLNYQMSTTDYAKRSPGGVGIIRIHNWGPLVISDEYQIFGGHKHINSPYANITGVPEHPAINGATLAVPTDSFPKISGGVFEIFAHTDFDQSIDQWDWTQVDRLDGLFSLSRYSKPFLSDTSHVKSFNGMYKGCTGTGIYVSGMDVSNMVSGVGMFAQSNINVSGLTIPPSADTSWLFDSCTGRNPSISAMNVSGVTDMKGWFAGYGDFQEDISDWDVSNVTGIHGMFYDCGFSGDLSSWNTSNFVDISDAFKSWFGRRGSGGDSVNLTFNISGWDLSKVEDISRLFYANSIYSHSADFLVRSGVKKIGSLLDSDYIYYRASYGYPWFGKSMPVHLDSWDTCTVEDMTGLFYGVDTSYSSLSGTTNGLVGPSVKNISRMFSRFSCTNLTHNFASWDVSSVENMNSLFDSTNSNAITTSDFHGISGWNTSSLQNATNIFYNSTQFNSNISNWNLSGVTVATGVFAFCTSFNQPLPTFPTGVDLQGLLRGCTSFNQDMSHQSFNGVNMYLMLNNCNSMSATNIHSINPSGGINRYSWIPTTYNSMPPDLWVTGQYDLERLFAGCSSFNQNISSWDVSHITDMGYMFQNCSSFNQDLSSWDVSSCKNFTSMFSYCSAINFNIGSWQPPASLTGIGGMLRSCNAMTNIDLGDWDVSNCTSFVDLFSGSAWNNHPRLAGNGSWLSDWDNMTAQVTNFSYMFNNNWYNTNLAVENWNVGSGIYFYNMFYNSQFNNDISNWDTSSATTMSRMFYYNWNFNRDISSWDVSKVQDFNSMFFGTRVFDQDLSDWDFSGLTNTWGLTGFKKRYTGWSGQNYGTTNYSNLLNKWYLQASSGQIPEGMTGVEVYGYYNSGAASARNSLVNDYGWTIIDRGQA